MFWHFPVWCSGLGVVLDCIDSWALPSSLLLKPISIICLVDRHRCHMAAKFGVFVDEGHSKFPRDVMPLWHDWLIRISKFRDLGKF